MANPGFGKRSAPDQDPRRRGDFAHLPEREAYLAAFIDRLPDGAAIDAKTLAKEQPRYGQQAVRSALNRLSAAGHLRRTTSVVSDAGRGRCVTRTHFSRTARDCDWWTCFLGSDSPTGRCPLVVHLNERPAQEEPSPEPAPRSRAYDALARLGDTDDRMVLSAAECAELTALAEEWLTRGRTGRQLAHALTAGLPPQVHSPAAIARRRLIDKMPPEAPRDAPPLSPERVVLQVMVCTNCETPGRPEALPGGLCRDCRGEPPSVPDGLLSATEVHARVERLRAAVGVIERSRT